MATNQAQQAATAAAVGGTGERIHAGPPSRRLRRDALANQERVLAAAMTAMLREGRHVPMATIAEEAGVGVGTLYRRYPTREALLAALTERSFAMVWTLAEQAARRKEPARAALRWFLEGTIDHRNQLVLPLHGGPATLTATARQTQHEVHAAIGRLLQRGQQDRTIRADVTPHDIVIFGAMLAQPLPNAADWDSIARRQAEIFLSGLSPHADSAEEP
jgi:AcrR family transcriptional regulator